MEGELAELMHEMNPKFSIKMMDSCIYYVWRHFMVTSKQPDCSIMIWTIP